jgi:biopolymer transport protein ExbB/TolQ
VHSFVRIGELQTADIATVAPGIAEALITTLAGLIVAIPALAMYHYVANKVRVIERLLFVCSDQISMIMQSMCGKE